MENSNQQEVENRAEKASLIKRVFKRKLVYILLPVIALLAVLVISSCSGLGTGVDYHTLSPEEEAVLRSQEQPGLDAKSVQSKWNCGRISSFVGTTRAT